MGKQNKILTMVINKFMGKQEKMIELLVREFVLPSPESCGLNINNVVLNQKMIKYCNICFPSSIADISA